MRCLECGSCCRDSGKHGHACVVTGKDIANFKAISVFDGFQWVILYENGACPFLSNNKCLVQELKPTSCKKYFCEKAINNGGGIKKR